MSDKRYLCGRDRFRHARIFALETLSDTVLSHSFHPSTYDPFERKQVPLTGTCLNSGNTLFIRNTELIEDRIASGSELAFNSRFV